MGWREAFSDYHVYCVPRVMDSKVMYLTGVTGTGRDLTCVSRHHTVIRPRQVYANV